MVTKKPTIVYVDDERYNLTAFVAAFRRHYNILTCTSGKEAVELLKKNTVDLIITDQRMPEMTGVQFLEAVIAEYPEPVRMILTGFSDIEAITKAINTGCVLRYITKPWDEAELKQIIDMGLKIHELEQNGRLLMKSLEEELKKQKQTIELFQKYVPENISQQVLAHNQENSTTDGEFRIISILCSDIRQFTKLSESMDPKNLVHYLNAYFSVMVNCVTKNHGTIYKLMGDGLLALFGAPVSTIYNQRNAIYCALDMIKDLEEFNQSYGAKIGHQTSIGIGISTGEAVVGHVESAHFLSYVAIGEAVDMARKIENLTRDDPNSILISESTYNSVKKDIIAEPFEKASADGKLGKIYKVIKKKTKE